MRQDRKENTVKLCVLSGFVVQNTACLFKNFLRLTKVTKQTEGSFTKISLFLFFFDASTLRLRDLCGAMLYKPEIHPLRPDNAAVPMYTVA